MAKILLLPVPTKLHKDEYVTYFAETVLTCPETVSYTHLEVMIPVDKSMIAPGFGGVMVAESILFKVIFSPPAIATTTCVAAC